MSCCAAKTAEDRLEPYELRTLYVRQIKRLAQRGLFGQAISVFRELSKNLGVTAATKRLSNMAISDLLNAREFPVDRDAYRYLDRLHEALFFKNERQASHMCNLFIKHFDFDPPSDVANDLEEANKETLAKSGLSVITICGMDLSSKKKLKKLKELLSRCPEVKKIELVFCSLTNERLLELFEAMMNLKCLLFLGLRGNKLDNRVVFKLHKLLEEPDNFPALVWTDFRNNKGIITIPGAFVQLLMQRRLTFNAEKEETPDERVAISVQDAMNGKVC
ncbi:Leucine rich repeat containing 75B [Porites harrisoni]